MNTATKQHAQQNAGILILGIGNLLLGDEGVGVHLVQQLMQESWPPGVDLLDGGTAGIQLMEAIEVHDHVILIDATMDGLPAGTIREIRPRFAHDFPSAMSTHDIGLKDLVSGLTLLGKRPDILLFVVSIEGIQPMHIGLSPAVEAAMPALKIMVSQKVREMLAE